VNAARTLDEYNVAGLEILEQPAAGCGGVGEKEGCDPAGAGRRGEMFGVAMHADNQVEAGFGSGASAGGVERGPKFPELKHFAGNKDTAAGEASGQGTNHGTESFGI
jgi:hypothetical protein